jgi:peptide/nickel transport system permease protein
MIPFLIKRIALIVVTLLVVSLAIFIFTEILPGDAAQSALGSTATEARLELLREELNLNSPAYERYLLWIGGVVQGDLGHSQVNKRPVTEILPRRIKNSVFLAVFALLTGIPLAVMAGIWAGVRVDGLVDRLVSLTSLIGISLPEFVTGVILMLVLASTFHIVPPSSIMLAGESPLTRPEIMVMPAMTLTGVLFAYIMRMTRANVIEVMQTHYVRTAILKGLPMRRVIVRHVLPNAMLPTITVIAMNFGWMLGGLIIVENVFSYPGLGQLLLRAIQTRDVPLLESLSLLIAATYAISNLIADIIYAALDPRVRLA